VEEVCEDNTHNPLKEGYLDYRTNTKGFTKP
jgi:hypothetical protein